MQERRHPARDRQRGEARRRRDADRARARGSHRGDREDAAAVKPANPNLVAATLKNGKTVNYDCSKAGNKEKKACGAK